MVPRVAKVEPRYLGSSALARDSDVSQWTEAERLAALHSYGILDTPPEPAFDGIARIAALVCRTPMALVNFVAEDRQWFKAEIGVGRRETPLAMAICTHALLQPDLFVVPDTLAEARFACNPLVTGWPHLQFMPEASCSRERVYRSEPSACSIRSLARGSRSSKARRCCSSPGK